MDKFSVMNCSLKPAKSSSSTELKFRQQILANIEAITFLLVTSLARTEALKLTYPVKVKNSDNIIETVVKFGSKHQRHHFTLLLHTMGRIHELLTHKYTCTVRDLFYGYVKFYQTQRKLETILGEICLIARVGRFDLPIQASAKGLIAGDLSWTAEDGTRMNLEEFNSKGMLITATFLEMEDMQSNAKFILFVEKDAVFQTLLQTGWIRTIDGDNFLIMTGKGYADRLTRRVLNHLSTKLKIPALALVDADPFGLDIVANIKWGPFLHDCLKMHNYSCEELKFNEETLPDIHWVGLRPSEIGQYAKPQDILPLTPLDEKKFSFMKRRAIINGEVGWTQEIDRSLKGNVKAEIEAVGSYLPQYLQQRITNYLAGRKSTCEGEKENCHDSQNIPLYGQCG